MKNSFSRRKLISLASVTAGSIALPGLFSCSSETTIETGATLPDEVTPPGGFGGEPPASPGDAGAGGGAVGVNNEADSAVINAAGGEGEWATGGTANIADYYDDPFASEEINSCATVSMVTEGPCRASSVERQDISEQQGGLPARVCMRILDENCNPLSGAVVDIWHCDTDGIYSGDDMPSVQFCTGGDTEAMAASWFRGKLTTDAEGKVVFNSCFPGWYPSRVVHIHFAVIVNGVSSAISQLGFHASLASEIFENEPLYINSGAQDTDNWNDNVFPSEDYDSFLFNTKKEADGVLTAWKTISVSR